MIHNHKLRVTEFLIDVGVFFLQLITHIWKTCSQIEPVIDEVAANLKVRKDHY